MDKVRIQEVAEEAGLSNGELIEKAKELGFDVKAANSAISLDDAGILVDYAISGTLPKGFKKSGEKNFPKALRSLERRSVKLQLPGKKCQKRHRLQLPRQRKKKQFLRQQPKLQLKHRKRMFRNTQKKVQKKVQKWSLPLKRYLMRLKSQKRKFQKPSLLQNSERVFL